MKVRDFLSFNRTKKGILTLLIITTKNIEDVMINNSNNNNNNSNNNNNNNNNKRMRQGAKKFHEFERKLWQSVGRGEKDAEWFRPT